MKDSKVKILISVPKSLLKAIDGKKGKQDRSTFICTTLETKFFADEMKEANS